MNNNQHAELFPKLSLLTVACYHWMRFTPCTGNSRAILTAYPYYFFMAHRRFFDPDHYRIVIFDQRGSGRSTPLGEIRDNTTLHLINDIETSR